MKTLKRKSTPRKRAPRIKTIKADGIVKVLVPPGTLPVVMHHPERHTVEVIPVPKPRRQATSWWDALFGTTVIRD